MIYFIVEHPSRGCFVKKYWEGNTPKYRFQWSQLRTHSSTKRFFRRVDCDEILSAVQGSYVLRVNTAVKGDGYIEREAKR